MSAHLQVVEQPRRRAGKAVRAHDQVEDFTVYQPAGFVVRWYALTLDVALSAPLDVIIHLPFKRYMTRLAAYGYDGKYAVLWLLLTAIPLLAYFVAPTLLWGQTLGKRIVGLRVVRSSFNPQLGPVAVLMRETVGKALSLALFGLGFLIVAANDRKRGLHDYLAGTQVIQYRER